VAVALALAVCTSAASARAQDVKDPEAAYKELNTWYADQLKKAREANTQVDFRALTAERTERAKAAVKDVDPEKVEPAKSLALAQLYQAAQDNAKMIVAANRFLSGNPEAGPRYSAHSLLLQGYSATDDADGLIRVLGEIKPPTPQMVAFLASSVAGRYADIVADKKGAQAGLDLIAKAEAAVPYAEMLAKPDVPGRDGKLGPAPEKAAAESSIAQVAIGRAELLDRAGKKDEAQKALQGAIEKLGPTHRFARSLKSKVTLMTMVGKPAPTLVQDRGYGGFKTLDDYKGKVVVVEFTAHW
jgi:hypothetical protein